MPDTHYSTLGVADGADPDDVRRAYLDLARQLHPDRWIDVSAAELEEVDRRMREVNEAFRVLGNPARRLAYDVERRETNRRARVSPPTAVGDRHAFSTGDLFTEDVEAGDLVTRFIRALPWILLIVGLGAIFVFTAYATSDDGVSPTGEAGGGCIRKVGRLAETADCDDDDAQQVVIEVTQVGDCPDGTDPFQPANRPGALCLELPPG